MTLDQINEWARIDWPASSTNIEHYSESGIDSLAMIRLDVAPDDLHAFVQALGFKTPLRPNYRPFPTEAEAPEWWIDRDLENAAGASVLLPGLCREIFVDKTGQDSYTVYLRTFEV